jgi:sigma54-dependent transcription regulator
VAGTDLPQSGVLECDTVSQEIACLRKTFGMTLPLALRALGMETVETREDLDRLAERLVNIGL